ncbi:hypothetical protein PYCCODRAFT_1101942 [Trametes coccinea BRFM310]|uniref:Uncharacterized protein n=1 Tax=Trametes coccinea (strain BRFM310) TaxID=1353009 RepID=A0A1Y2IBG3_TRAC3|nr:hypothetical protein PYCCODRAFT_1101942 [Trametes coccinea BRFM310]
MSTPFNCLSDDILTHDTVLDFFDDDDTMVLPSVHPPSSFSRIRRLLDYSHAFAHHYSLSRLPHDTYWDERRNPPALCHDGLPLQIRMVGYVHSVDYEAQGFELQLTRVVDHNAHVQLLQLGVPRPVRYPSTVALYPLASHVTAGADPNTAYIEVFDATRRLRPAEFMDRVGLTAVDDNDVLIVDAACVQQPTSEGWDVAFEPLLVCLLRSARNAV